MQDLQTTQIQSPLDIIIEWSKGLPLWQQDALRRIIEFGDVSAVDVDDLVELCLSNNGIEDSDLVARPIQDGDLPQSDNQTQTVTLSSISEVENANALDSGQQLTFGESGLTVIFGNNGSGKSGYGRIFRRACRSRSKGAAILPNVLAISDGSPANAVIAYCLNGTEQSPEQWIDGQRAVNALGTISFFDAECAVEHVRSKNDIAFTPFGMDVLPKLGAACKKVQAQLDSLRRGQQGLRPEFLNSKFAHGDHTVGQFLSKLSESSDTKVLDLLANLAPEDQKRLEEISKLLGADPKEKTKLLKGRIEIVLAIQNSLGNASTLLGSVNVETLQKLANDAENKKTAAEAAASRNFSGDPLEGVGTQAWKQLWSAAREYSQIAYPDATFPQTGDQGACLLCQQKLDGDAEQRLKRFDEFISDQTERKSQQAEKNLTSVTQALKSFCLETEAFVLRLGQLGEVSEELHSQLIPKISSLIQRKSALLNAVETNKWALGEPVKLGGITSKLNELRTNLSNEIEKLELLSKSDERVKLTAELAGLRSREWLSTVVKEVKLELVRLTRIQQLNACIGETKTNRITAKSKELAQQFVTDQLRNAFADEIKKMHQGTRRLNVELASTSGELGSSNHRVRLVGATDSEIGTVVSEGEHRCIALAGFLSELTTDSSRSAIIFDDPVTSLDHNWRECFSKRLVEEAENRQVIVFTHDIVFLHDLLTLTDRTGVACHIQRLSSNATVSGLVSGELPWFGKKVPQRIDELEQDTRRAKQEYDAQNDDVYEREISSVYSRLRATVERSVEEVVFRGVVIRHRDYVNVSNLKPVSVFDLDDCNDLMNLFQKCCDITEAHDRAALKSFGVPSPTQALFDIDELKRVVREIKEKQKDVS